MHGLGRAELDCTMLHLAQSGDTVIIIDLPNISAHEVPGDQVTRTAQWGTNDAITAVSVTLMGSPAC